MLLETNDDEKIMLMGEMLKKVDNITVSAFAVSKARGQAGCAPWAIY